MTQQGEGYQLHSVVGLQISRISALSAQLLFKGLGLCGPGTSKGEDERRNACSP